MLYSGPAHFHVYELVTVVNAASGRQKRIIVSKPGESGGMSFYRNGKNCFYPQGMTKLIPVVDWVVEQMQGKQKIMFDWNWEVVGQGG